MRWLFRSWGEPNAARRAVVGSGRLWSGMTWTGETSWDAPRCGLAIGWVWCGHILVGQGGVRNAMPRFWLGLTRLVPDGRGTVWCGSDAQNALKALEEMLA